MGGTLDEVTRSEAEVNGGNHPERPFVLVAQPSVIDPSRAPEGQHTLWAYCHVPNGSPFDMTDRMEAQIERFAPGFRQRIVAKATRTAVDMEAYNPNFLGGDINGGARRSARPFSAGGPLESVPDPGRGVYLCSASTPPGGGVHGMCGVSAADVVLRERFGRPDAAARPRRGRSGGAPDRMGRLVTPPGRRRRFMGAGHLAPRCSSRRPRNTSSASGSAIVRVTRTCSSSRRSCDTNTSVPP